MAHSFPPIPAKPAFGTLKENLFQSDYINRKKSRFVYCRSPSYCNKIKIANSYNMLNLYNLGRYTRSLETCNVIPVNKGNLVFGQYTKLNLKNVCTISTGTPPTKPCQNDDPCDPCQNNAPVSIDPTSTTTSNPFYFNATIDPLGELGGNSQCGQLNFTRYMIINSPLKL